MAAAAGRIIAIEKSFKKLKEAGAFSPETAVTPEQVGVTSKYMLNDLIRYKNVKRTEEGRYYVPCKDGKHC
jgi:hypothetical protein